MVIVHLGAVSLQVERSRSRQAFVEWLIAQVEEKVRHVVERCIEETLEAKVTGLLEREWYERHKPPGQRRVPARCNRCGSQAPQDFRRDGHYLRYLDTSWGRLRISVPQVECICEGTVKVPFQTLRSRQRIWDDLEGEIRERCGWGMSLRWIKEWLDARLSSSVGPRTLNERVRQIAQLVPGWQHEVLEEVPPVVRVDGIWVTLMVPTGEVKKDRLGRRRPVKQARKVPILVAQGVWPTSGRQEVVTWVLGRQEDEESWEVLLTQMYERGICPERGLCLLIGDGSAGLREARQTAYWDVLFQRCIFHKLRNIWPDIVMPEGLEGRTARAYKRRFIHSAARVWQAPDVVEARRRQRRFCKKWEEQQPAAVATMRRDFEDTLTFYHVQAAAALRRKMWPARRLWTTSPLEPEFRASRRRLAGTVLFHSPPGLTAVFHQLLARRGAHRANALPLTWRLHLERALSKLNQIS